MNYSNSLKYMNSFMPSSSSAPISPSRAALLCSLLGGVNRADAELNFIFIPSGAEGYAVGLMLESVIKREGYAVGRMTSEFGFDSRSMLSVNCAPAAIPDYNRAVAALKDAVLRSQEQGFLFEEASFALALLICRMIGCRYIILQGMSGDELDLSSLCAPYDIVVAPTAHSVQDPLVQVLCRAISQGTRAIVSGNQSMPVYTRISSACKGVGVTFTVKKNFKVNAISSLRLDFTYVATRSKGIDCTLRSPSLSLCECAMLTIETIQAMRNVGVTVKGKSIQEGLASVTSTGLFDVFSVSPLMLFDSAENAYEISSMLNTLDEVFGRERYTGLSLCVPEAIAGELARFENIKDLTVVGGALESYCGIAAENTVICKDASEAARVLREAMISGDDTLVFGSVAFSRAVKCELLRISGM